MFVEAKHQVGVFKRFPLLSDYPKSFVLKDKREVIIRPMIKEDVEELYKFFSKLDKEDKQFLRDDVSKKEVIEKWAENLNYDVVLPLLAFYDGEVVADGTLHASNYFWSRHVAEIRLVVAKDFRNVGLGKKIVSELFFIAVKRGFKKIVAQIPFHQQNTIRIFESLGFEKEAILRKHVIVQGKGFSDLLIMSIFTDNVVQSIKRAS
jgi:RimJ/RimL family protein N-acetyltransferase